MPYKYNMAGLSGGFPRQLSNIEKDWISSALPESKPGYKKYKERLFSLYIIGNINDDSFILGEKGSVPDNDIAFPVFAAGNIEYETGNIYVTISTEEEKQFEVDFDINLDNLDNLVETRRWSYSDWEPGKGTPEDNSPVREVEIIKDSLTLAIAPDNKKIWIHETSSGINYPIPVTNFYNELMRVLKIKDAETVLNSNKFFADLNKYTDRDLSEAFLVYNKRWKKTDIDYTAFKEKLKRNDKPFFGFFKRS